MVLAVTVDRTNIIGNRREKIISITADASWADGGESLTPGMCGLSQIDWVESAVAVEAGTGTLGYVVGYDYVNEKLLAYMGSAGTAAGLPQAATKDLSGHTLKMRVIGM
ncbi:MAG: hypothetical protein ACT6FG_00230 [Methanosarcinaceae archaeon]